MGIDDKVFENEIFRKKDIATEIYDQFRRDGTLQRSNVDSFSFIIAGLEFIHKRSFSKTELLEIITDGDKDLNIDAVWISEGRIHIYDFSKENPENDQVITFSQSIQQNILGVPHDYNIFNSRLKRILQNFHNRGVSMPLSVYMVRKTDYTSSPKINELKDLIERTEGGKFIFLNTTEIIKKITIEDNSPPLWECNWNTAEGFISENEKDATVLISAYELITFCHKCKNDGFNLFNKNIRIFLNQKTFKKSIIETLQASPGMFHWYNNGLVLTTSKIKRGTSGKLILHNPQIINGAQTLNSIYDFFNSDMENELLKRAKVLCKFVLANDPLLVAKICETSNTQINIKLWDLRSNDDIQIKLEKIINGITGFGYVRKGTKKIAGNRTIFIDKFIQIYYACKFGKPAYAKDKKRKLFEINGLYKDIVDNISEARAEDIERICLIYDFVEKYIEGLNQISKGLLRDADFHIMAIMFCKNFRLSINKIQSIQSELRRYVLAARRREIGITNNKIFTKSATLFTHLLRTIR